MTVTIRPTSTAASTDLDALSDDELVVVLDGLAVADPTVVGILRDLPADQHEPTVRDALRIGARALVAARTGGEAKLVSEALARLDGAVDDLGTAAHERAAAAGTALVEAVERRLFAADSHVMQTLRKLDPDQASGLLQRLKTEVGRTVAEANTAQRREVQQLVTETVASMAEKVTEQVGTIREDLAAQAASRDMFRKTSLLGQSYEDTVEACLGDVLDRNEVVESCGAERGATGSKVGDHVVTLQVGGVAHRVVVEDKTTRVSVPKLREEARAAMANRDATRCVWVTNSPDLVPGKRHLVQLDTDITVVVVDDETPDTVALDLALAAMRLDIAREQAEADDGDEAVLRGTVAGARHEVDRLVEALGTFRNIRTNHTQAEKGIAAARDHVDALEQQLKTGIDALKAALVVAGDGAGTAELRAA